MWDSDELNAECRMKAAVKTAALVVVGLINWKL